MFSEEEWTRYGDELRRPLLVAKGLAEADSVLVVGGGPVSYTHLTLPTMFEV